VRNLTRLVPAIVFGVLLVGWLVARISRATRDLPSFAAPRAVEFEPLVSPLGPERLWGKVVDPFGEPLAGVGVVLRSNSVPLWTETDAQGQFELSGLQPGEVDVALVLWGRAPVHQLATPGEVTLVLPEPNPPPAELTAAVRAPIAGRLAHPLRRAWSDAEGYEVALVPIAPPQEFGGTVERRVHTDRQGVFAFDDLALGSYRIVVLPSWAAGGSWPDLADPAHARLEHGQDGGGLVVVLGLGALDVEVTDELGSGIAGALALLTSAAQPARIWPPATADARGHLRFLDLPPGRYTLSVRAGEGQSTLENVEIASGEILPLRVGPISVRQR
jgi:hypothetical protein